MAEWPKLYHPTEDPSALVEGYQLRPDTWRDLAVWCSGQQVVVDGDQAVMVGATTARLGDFVMRQDGAFQVEPADGHYQRWVPA